MFNMLVTFHIVGKFHPSSDFGLIFIRSLRSRLFTCVLRTTSQGRPSDQSHSVVSSQGSYHEVCSDPTVAGGCRLHHLGCRRGCAPGPGAGRGWQGDVLLQRRAPLWSQGIRPTLWSLERLALKVGCGKSYNMIVFNFYWSQIHHPFKWLLCLNSLVFTQNN